MPWILSLEISSFWRILSSNSFNMSVFFSVSDMSETLFSSSLFEELKYRPLDLFPVISFSPSFSLHNENELDRIFHFMGSQRRTESTLLSLLRSFATSLIVSVIKFTYSLSNKKEAGI